MSTNAKRPLSPTQLRSTAPPPKKVAPPEPTATIFRDSAQPLVVPVPDSSTYEPPTTTMPTVALGWKVNVDNDNHHRWTLDPECVPSFNQDSILDILSVLGYTYRKSSGYHHPDMGSQASMRAWGENFAHENGLRKFMCRRGIPGVPANPDWDDLLGLDDDDDHEEDEKKEAAKSGNDAFYNSNAGSDDEDEDPQLSLQKWVAFANVPLLERTTRTLLPKVAIPSNEQAIQWLIRDYGFQVDTDSGNVFRYRVRDGGVDYFANVEELRRKVQCMDEAELMEQPQADAAHQADTPLSPEPSRRTSRRRRTPAKSSAASARVGRRRSEGDEKAKDADENQLLALMLWAALTPSPIPVFGDEHAHLPVLPTAHIAPAVAAMPGATSTMVDDYYFDTSNTHPEEDSENMAVPRLSHFFNRKQPAVSSTNNNNDANTADLNEARSRLQVLQNELFQSINANNDPEADKPLSEAIPMGCIIL